MAPVLYSTDPAETRYYREQASPFSFLYNMARENASELAGQGRRPILGGLLSKEPTYGLDTLQYEGIGPALVGLLSTIGKAIDAPYSAYQGLIPEADLVPEVMGTAGLAMGGGGLVSAPKNSLRSGVSRTQSDLPPASNASEAMAKKILELRAAGRSNEVTNEMMGVADNQYMFANTPLDMSQAARMARADEMGFDQRSMHGTGANISAIDKEKFGSKQNQLGKGFYTTTNPKRADTYVPKDWAQSQIEGKRIFAEGGNVLPVMSRNNNILNLDEPMGISNNKSIGQAFEGPDFNVEYRGNGDQVFIKSKSDPNLSVYLDSYQPAMVTIQKLKDVFGKNNVTEIMEKSGFSGLESAEALGNRVRVNYNPADIRSQYARFDPEFSNLSNISAANRSKLGGLLALQEMQKRANEKQYTRGLLE